MKKRIKLFSSALAIGMLLGTGVGAMSSVAQHVPGTTVTAKASTSRAQLTADQLKVNSDGKITGLKNDDPDANAEFIAALKEGHLTIPKQVEGPDGEPVIIKEIDVFRDPDSYEYTGVFSKDNLIDVFNLENFDGLKTVTFDDDSQINYIGTYAFANNQLTDVVLPESLDTISVGAFQNNRLTNVNFPDSIKSIEDEAFINNQLQSVELKAIENIYNEAFAENQIKTVSVNKDYESSSEILGSVNNPRILASAFTNQDWDSLTMDYNTTISNESLVGGLGLTYEVNNREYKYLGSVEDINDANNIDWHDDGLTVTSNGGGNAVIDFSLSGVTSDSWRTLMTGAFKLNVNPKSTQGGGSQPDNGNNSNETDTNPDNGTGGESGNNNGNETKPQPAPKPEERRPHTVYAKRGMRLHRNVSLTSPIRSYKKQSRAKAANFRVRGIAYDKNGKKRYKVDGGYITAGSSYVADSHFRSNKVRQVRVLSNRVNSYKDVKLSSNKKVRSYKKGTKLRVKRVVNWGRATRFELTNGRYITGNKQLLIMDQK
ncbi:leucine-rich repeat domain-containing protein [Secundilactobacillus mixtipabuli]|uniref:DUF5776 domain-containing protein n=1 Tax=Secundilactobacillus mixtipabuli TaxID=1435342 RepID=A0A1Z5I8X4_9LACO|nr:leucine-rich repeat domain-containing protein [Secundilactobacillus mixtipabuli]GAW98209.1 hypothetical protein IWT30_00152 [Secundilactobacillus mixtipabuli]